MISLHEEHGEVVATWARLGYRHESIVCFDRHLDLKPLAPRSASRLAELRAASHSVDAVAAENRKLPLREMPGSFGLDDFYAAGAALEHVDRLTWVRASDGTDTPAARRALLTHIALIAAEPDALSRTAFDEHGALRTRLCGLDLVVQTPRMFAATPPPATTRVDIDLDWFADVSMGQDHEPAELLDLLRAHGLDRNVDSMTFSVRSGFLPPANRGLANELATSLGQRTERCERDVMPLPAETFARLRGHASDENFHRYQAELDPLGPIGEVLRGLLHLTVGRDLELAEEAWRRATEGGCRSAWLAYRIALAFYEIARFGPALQWFTRATGALVDTIEVKSAFMTSLCRLRLGEIEAPRQSLLEFARRYPLHINSARLAFEIGERIGAHAPDWLVAQLHAQRTLTEGPGK